MIKFKDVKGIEKNKLKANSIKIRLENEKFQFMNLSSRDKILDVLIKIWQKELKKEVNFIYLFNIEIFIN